MLTQRFGAELAKARKAAGLDQKALGASVGVGYQRISAYENGADVGLEMAERLAKAVDEPVYKLLGFGPPAGETADPRRAAILERMRQVPDHLLPAVDLFLSTLSPGQSAPAVAAEKPGSDPTRKA